MFKKSLLHAALLATHQKLTTCLDARLATCGSVWTGQYFPESTGQLFRKVVHSYILVVLRKCVVPSVYLLKSFIRCGVASFSSLRKQREQCDFHFIYCCALISFQFSFRKKKFIKILKTKSSNFITVTHLHQDIISSVLWLLLLCVLRVQPIYSYQSIQCYVTLSFCAANNTSQTSVYSRYVAKLLFG